MRQAIWGVGLSVLTLATAHAQVATQPASTQSRPAGIDEAFSARVIEVLGNVSYAKPGEEAKWTPAKVGDVLPAGTRVRTMIRSRLGLAFGDDTVVVVERATLASIDQFHRSGDTKLVQLGLGHGTIRASVAETTLRSDMTIQTPTATLSKRGTQDFGISYEPSSGRYRVWLAGDGLVSVLDELWRRSKFVRPGGYITQAMLKWIDMRTIDRWVPIVDVYGTTQLEQAFQALNSSGLAVTTPAGSNQIATFSAASGMQAAGLQSAMVIPVVPIVPSNGRTAIVRPEGNFGTGRR